MTRQTPPEPGDTMRATAREIEGRELIAIKMNDPKTPPILLLTDNVIAALEKAGWTCRKKK
jgi:hypothetical protein